MSLVRVGVAGDIHGAWQEAIRQLRRASSRVGGLDVVFQIGDAQAYRQEGDRIGLHPESRHKHVHSDYPSVMTGEGPPAALYFIGGNHEPWIGMDRSGAGPWGRDDVVFLGRAGCVKIAGLVVAFLSGIYSEAVADLRVGQRVTTAQRAYWTRTEVEDVRVGAAAFDHVDVLLTHNWPSGLGLDRHGRPAGGESERALTVDLAPTVHLCGHYHRRMSAHINHSGVEMLGVVAPGTTDGVIVIEVDTEGAYQVL